MTKAGPEPSAPPTRPDRCPACGHEPVAQVRYGMPGYSEQLKHDLAAGRVVLGGCIIFGEDPPWACTSCGATISARGTVVGTDPSMVLQDPEAADEVEDGA